MHSSTAQRAIRQPHKKYAMCFTLQQAHVVIYAVSCGGDVDWRKKKQMTNHNFYALLGCSFYFVAFQISVRQRTTQAGQRTGYVWLSVRAMVWFLRGYTFARVWSSVAARVPRGLGAIGVFSPSCLFSPLRRSGNLMQCLRIHLREEGENINSLLRGAARRPGRCANPNSARNNRRAPCVSSRGCNPSACEGRSVR